MIIKDHTRIDLAQGGTRFKQGDFVELAFTPRDAAGKVVDLTGKDIEASIWNRSKGVIYQGAASFDSAEKLIRVTIKETLDHGKFQIEFTVTDSTDVDYRRKFPSDEYNGVINITPSTDNMDVVGVQMMTVEKFRAEFDQALNALPVDSEINLARVATDGTVYPNLPARLTADQQATATQLADKVTRISGLVNALDFGLKGDNTDDSAAFISMLSVLPSGSRIQFSKGIYNLSALPKPFQFPEKVFYFYGVGRDETIIRGSIDKTNSFNLMTSFKMQDIQMQNWRFFELKKSNSSYNFITFKECRFVNCTIPAYCFDDTIEIRNYTFNDCLVENGVSAFRLSAKVRSSNVNYNEVNTITETGFHIGSDTSEGESYKINFIGNRLNGMTASSSYRGAMFYANEIKATHNIFENMSFAEGVVKANFVMTGIYIRSFARLSMVENNTFKNIDGWAIQVKDADGKVTLANNHVLNDNPTHTISRGFHVSVAKHINIDSNHLEGLKNSLPIWCLATVGIVSRNTIVNCASDIGVRIESPIAGGSLTVKDNEIETIYKSGVQNYSIVGYSIPDGEIEITGNKLRNIGEKGTKYGVYVLMNADATAMRSIKATGNSVHNMQHAFGVRGATTPALKFLRIQSNDVFNTTNLFNSTHTATTQLTDLNNMIA